MNRFISLTKVLLKTGGNVFTDKNSKASNMKSIILKIAIGLCFVPLAIGVGAIVGVLFDSLESIDQVGVVLGLGFSLNSFIIFFFGIFSVMGVFYFSMDINNLLPLPFKSWEIISAKFITVLVYEYIVELVILLPIIITYGIKSSAGITFYLQGILVYLTLPIIPLVLASVIVMVIMRFTNVAKNKDKFRVIGGIVAIIMAIVLNIFTQRISGGVTSPEEMQQLVMSGSNSLLGIVNSLFPTSKLAALFMVKSQSFLDISNLVYYIISNIFSIILFILLAQKMYIKGVIGISETTSRRRALSNKEFDKSTVNMPITLSYTIKELRVLFRTPAYFLNCVLINFIWIIFIIIPLFTSTEMFEDINKGLEFIRSVDSMGLVLVSALALIVFVSMTNGIASTSISREGSSFFINKYLPIEYSKQILSKILSAIIMGSVSIVMVLIITIYLFDVTFIELLIITIAGLLGVFYTSTVGVLIDTYNPKLNWDSEQKAVKQNFNLLISMIPSLIPVAILVFFVIKTNISFWMVALLVLGFYGIVDIILYYFILNQGSKLYSRI